MQSHTLSLEGCAGTVFLTISQAFQLYKNSEKRKSQNLSVKLLGDYKEFNPEIFIHYCALFARSACRAISGTLDILLVEMGFKTESIIQV